MLSSVGWAIRRPAGCPSLCLISNAKCHSSSASPLLDPDLLISPAHRELTVSKFRSSLPLRGDSRPREKQAAVFVPIMKHNNKVNLLYTKRICGIPHGGEVCFPGGNVDAGEGLEEAAVREMEEEVGIPADRVEVWGRLPSVMSKNGEMDVFPIIGTIRSRANAASFTALDFSINHREVLAAFAVPVEELISPAACKYTQFPKYSLPVYDVQPYRIWGLTAIITLQFLMAFLPAELRFRHPIHYHGSKKVVKLRDRG